MAASTEIRKCIYCLLEYLHSRKRASSHFTREHVIHEALTAGVQNNLTLLGVVCQKCNSDFGEDIDQRLTRSGYIGMIRFDTGQKDPKRFREYDQSSLDLTAHKPEDSALHGTRVKRVLKDGKLLSEFDAVVSLELPEGWKSLTEAEIDAGDVPVIGAAEIKFQMLCEPDDEPRIRQKLAKFYREVDGSQQQRIFGTTNVFGRGELGVVEIRALTKIAFNYFAHVCFEDIGRPNIPFLPAFHEVRVFIRLGIEPETNPLSEYKPDVLPANAVTTLPSRYGHAISIEQEPNGLGRYRVLCKLNLFNSITWRIVLANDVALDEPNLFMHSHEWNLAE